jgi:hypothetical protein
MLFVQKQNADLLKSARSWGALGLFLVVAVALGLVTVAQQAQPAQPVTEIKIVPEKPIISDKITVELSGAFPNGCVPAEVGEVFVIRQAARAQVIIYLTNREFFCLDVPTKWALSVPVGKLPDAGLYQVFVLFNMTKYEEPKLLLGRKAFDVLAQPTASAQGDQAGRQPDPRTALSILVVDRARPDGTWVTFPDAVEIAVSDPGLPNESLPCSPGKTCHDAHSVRVSAPSAGAPGTEVELSITLSNQNTHKFVGCGFEQNVAVVDNCTRPPDRPTKEKVKFKVTGPDPVFKFLLEQEALPDLTVDIRANVRRYTEREQVFCDVTLFTTARNIGKGPAGSLRTTKGIKTSKMNTFRVGMSPGGEATMVDFDSRLRPGVYSYEAEVKSLSIKESNTANNKAMQVVTCR